MTMTSSAPPPSVSSPQPSRARRLGAELIHGSVVMTCGLAIVFRAFQYSNLARIWSAPEIRFGVLAVIIFAASWAATDQAKHYRRRLALLDGVEAALMLEVFYLLGLVPETGRVGMPAPGWAMVVLGVAVFLQMLWRRWAYLKNHPDHWDFRFLVMATAGTACAATGWLQVVFLAVSAALVALYVLLRLNA